MITPEGQAILDKQKPLAQPKPRGQKRFDRFALAEVASKGEKLLGVSYHVKHMRYQARLRLGFRHFFIGDFKLQMEAVFARDNGTWFLQDFSRYAPKLNFSTPLEILPKVAFIRAELLAACDGIPPHPRPGFTPPVIPKLTRADYELSRKDLRTVYYRRVQELSQFARLFNTWKEDFFVLPSNQEWKGTAFQFQMALAPFCGGTVPWHQESIANYLRDMRIPNAKEADGCVYFRIQR